MIFIKRSKYLKSHRCKQRLCYIWGGLYIGIALGLLGCDDDPDALFDQGSSLAHKKQYSKALEVFQRLGELESTDQHKYRAIYGQSQVYQRMGDLGEQYKLLDQLMKDTRFARYQKVIKEDLEENLLSRAKVEKSKPDPREALSMYREALGLNPKSEAREHLTEFLRAQGDEALSERRLDEALKFYHEIEKLNASDELLVRSIGRKVEQVKLAQYRLKVERSFAPQLTELTRSKLYDPKTKTFYFKVESYAVGRVTRKNQAEQEQLARTAAELIALHEVSQRVKEWFNLSASPKVNEALISVTKGEFQRRMKRIKLEGRNTRVTPFHYYFSLPLGAVYQLAFQVARQSEAQGQ